MTGNKNMKQYLWIKVIAGLLGLGLLLMGISVMEADPTLRETQQVTMEDIEAGRLPRDGQRVQLRDAWLLPTWVVDYSHSRRRGDHAHVHVALGSRATFQRAVAGEPVDVKLWLRMPQDYKTREAASAALNDPALYGRAQDHDGVVNALPDSVRDNIASGGGKLTTQATLRLEAGRSPGTKGSGAGMLAAGGMLLALVAAWLATDHANAAWRRGLAAAGVTPFQGASRWLIALGLVLLQAPLLAMFIATDWVDSQQLDGAALAFLALLLGVAGLALQRNRVAWLVTSEGLARAGRGGSQTLLRWDDVQMLGVAPQSFRGHVRVTYTLQAGARKLKVGNGLFAGGVADHEGLGELLRDQVNRRIGPALLARLAGGDKVAFGALGASRTGLIKGRLETGDVLPWAEIESSTLAKGKLRIKRKGKLLAWENVALGKLRNPDVLMHLIQQRGLAAAPASAG